MNISYHKDDDKVLYTFINAAFQQCPCPPHSTQFNSEGRKQARCMLKAAFSCTMRLPVAFLVVLYGLLCGEALVVIVEL